MVSASAAGLVCAGATAAVTGLDRDVVGSNMQPSRLPASDGRDCGHNDGAESPRDPSRCRWRGQHGGCRAPWHGRAGHAIHADRPGDILECVLAHVLETKIELARDLIIDARRNADAPGFGDGFKPRGDIDAIAEQIVVFYDHVAEIDPDAKLHLAAGRKRVVARLERLLDFDRAAHGFDGAREFGEHRIARGAHDAPAVKGNDSVDDGPVCGQHTYRAFLVVPHLAAVPDSIGSENASQATLDVQRFHDAPDAGLGMDRRLGRNHARIDVNGQRSRSLTRRSCSASSRPRG